MGKMMRIIHLAVLVTMCLTSEACEKLTEEKVGCKENCVPVVEETRIPWSSVTARSFRVTWKGVPSAKCYNVYLLKGYTIRVDKVIKCQTFTTLEFKKLNPNRIYGVRVSAVSHNCIVGRSGIPARTRTYWAPPIPTTRPPRPTPKMGKCGRGKFTCASSNECINNRKWCDRRFDCDDESDERACPGSCEEIDIDFTNGNYSCSRWGSPGSVCLFDCDDGYALVGNRITSCSKERKWTKKIPECKLKPPTSITIEDTSTDSITVSWEVENKDSKFIIFAKGESGQSNMKNATIEDCCNGVITGLDSGTEYSIRVAAFYDVDSIGKRSTAVTAETAERVETMKTEGDATMMSEQKRIKNT